MSAARRAPGVAMSPESAVRLWVDATNRHHGLDPLYRRRLRGTVMNTFVAARHGTAVAPTRSARRMGTLGRACLYGSFAVALSVGTAMAASGAAVPGDALYPLKRGIEQLRAAVLPAPFGDDLAAYEFAQRTHELARLLEAGDTERALALLTDVRASYDRLVAARPDVLVEEHAGVQVTIVQSVLQSLPTPVSDAIQHQLGDVPSPRAGMRPGQDSAPQRRGHERPSNGNGVKGVPGPSTSADDGATDQPPSESRGRGPDATRSPEPSPSPSPEPAPVEPEDDAQ